MRRSRRVAGCVKDAHKDEATQPEWVGVRFQLAQALLKKGEALPAESAEHRKLVTDARDAYPNGREDAGRVSGCGANGGGKGRQR